MDEFSQEFDIDEEIRVTGGATSELNTIDLERNCLNVMQELKVENDQTNGTDDSNSEYFNAKDDLNTPQLDNKFDDELDDYQQDLDVPEIETDQVDLDEHPEIDESQELEVSLAKINEIIAKNSQQEEPDIHQPSEVFAQPSQQDKNKIKNTLSTQMELKAIHDILVDYQTEDILDDVHREVTVNFQEEIKSSQKVRKRSTNSVSKYSKISINQALPNVLNFTTVAIAGETRKIGKSTLTYEIVSDVLFQYPEKQIIFIDILNGYDAEKQAAIFKKHCKEKNLTSASSKELDRIKVLRISCNREFHSIMSRLEMAIKHVPDTCLLIIDNLAFFYQDSYGFKFFGRGITRKEFVKHYLKIFHAVAIETGVTILFTLPEHILRANNTHDLIKKSNKEAQIIYEHIQQKVELKKSFSVSDQNPSEKLPSNSPGHKSDSEIDNVKPDMHDKLLDKNEIDAGISIILSNLGLNRYKLKIYQVEKLEDSEKAENEFYYRIKEDGMEFREKTSKQQRNAGKT